MQDACNNYGKIRLVAHHFQQSPSADMLRQLYATTSPTSQRLHSGTNNSSKVTESYGRLLQRRDIDERQIRPNSGHLILFLRRLNQWKINIKKQ